jgi:hypothetical protein
MKSNVLIASILAIMLIGCATTNPPAPKSTFKDLVERNPQCFFKVPRIGIDIDKDCSIKKIHNISVKEADMRIGDVVTGIDDIAIATQSQLLKIIAFDKHVGDNVLLTVRRNGEILKKRITLVSADVSKIEFTLFKILTIDGKKVILAITTGDITNISAAQMGPETFLQWQKEMGNSLVSRYENHYLERFGGDEKFQLVDRRSILKVLQEQKMQESGIISSEYRAALGKMLGVTHLLVMDLSRNREGKKTIDTLYERLIEIETGKTLTSINCIFSQ